LSTIKNDDLSRVENFLTLASTLVGHPGNDIRLVATELEAREVLEFEERIVQYSVRGLERSKLGGSHGCPGRLYDGFHKYNLAFMENLVMKITYTSGRGHHFI